MLRFMRQDNPRLRDTLWVTVCVGFVFVVISNASSAEDLNSRGLQAYKNLCADCHGENGEGVEGASESPLHGTRSLEDLTRIIVQTMPEGDPEACIGEEAEAVSRYIYDAFYSPASRLGTSANRVQLSHFTKQQYAIAVSDIISMSRGNAAANKIWKKGGLKGIYYNGRRHDNKEKKIERIDPVIDFDFEEGTPGEEIENKEEFAIRWQGSIWAEEDGDYEFIMITENGARLWLNDNENSLIDEWTASHGPPRENRATIRLIGGRGYPIRLDMFKFKDKRSSMILKWKPPHGPEEVIPSTVLSEQGTYEIFVPTTTLPADDRVFGYERGISVSKDWHAATTSGALEVASYVANNIDRLAKTREQDEDRAEKTQNYCEKLVELALGRPLTDSDKKFYVGQFFEGEEHLDAAIKRCVLLTFKSPKFLYPTIEQSPPDDFDRATRLALALWNSVPDKALFEAATKGQLKTPEQITAHAKRMLDDPRAHKKMRDFLHVWLQLNDKEVGAKNEELFPDFDPLVLADLRRSLNMQLDEVVWSDSSDFRQLLLAEEVFLNARLAKIYGVEREFEAEFEKVRFEPEHRAGVVTHPYLMASLAFHDLSSPIHRGVFVTRRLLGRNLNPPPQATEFKDGDFQHGMTTREKVAVMTEPAACMSCHNVINPLGFSLEHFDAIGRFRDREEDKPIDASAIYVSEFGEEVKFNGAKDLARFISENRTAHGTFVDQLFHETIKHPIDAFGVGTRENLIEKFEQSGYNIRELWLEIAKVSTLHRHSPESEGSDVAQN